MKHLKTYEGLFDFFKKKPVESFDVIGTTHDLMLDFVDDGKISLVKQGKDYIQYDIMPKGSRAGALWKEKMDDTKKLIEPILKEWGVRYYFHHIYLFVISNEFYNEINNIFKGLRKAKIVDNSYQYLLVKNMTFYIYVNDEDMSVASNIIKYLTAKYDITVSSLWDILNEIIPTVCKVGVYMRCRSMDQETFKSIRFRYHQPEFK